MVASKIDTCAKSRVFANLAFNLLVLDSPLSYERSNWACPFGHCKLNFPDPKTLLRHVLDCPHFSSDRVFCNCCARDDSFEEDCQPYRPENLVSHETEKSPSRKRNPIRTISNILFPRNRTESRGSSPSSEYPVSPVSTHRRPSILSMMTPTPSPSNASRKGSLPTPQESSREASQPASPSRQGIPSELIGSELHIIQELQSQEISELSDTTRVSELPGAMFDDIMKMSESPTEDLLMDSMIPDQDMFHAYNASFSRQMEASHVEPHSANGLESAFQPRPQLQPCSFMQPLQQLQQQLQEAPWLPFESRASAAAVQGGICSTGDPMSSSDSFSTPPRQSHLHQGTTPLSSNHISGQMRKDSGGSAYSEVSSTTLPFEHTPQSGPVQESSLDSGHLAGSPLTGTRRSAPPNAVTVESSEDQDLSCPYSNCDYHPKGSRRENYAYYRRKHIDNTHLHRYRVRCPDCGNLLSRSDNLRVHQETACPRFRSSRVLYPPQRTARRHGAAHRREWGGGWQGE